MAPSRAALRRRTAPFAAACTTFVLSIVLAPEVAAQCAPPQLAKILAGDGGAGDQLGSAVAISSAGATALVGAPFDDDFASNTGAVYVYTFNGATWAQQAKLKASDGQANDQFGGSVAINAAGDRAVVGARLDDDLGTSSGSAYVFHRTGTTWTQVTKLKPLDAVAGDEFGLDVDIDGPGNWIVVGMPFDDFGTMTANAGSAYLFEFSGGWVARDKLVAQPLVAGENNGSSVAIADGGFTVASGAPLAETGMVQDTGAVYVFGFNGGGHSQVARLTASDGAASDQLGDAIAIDGSGTRVLAGAIGDDDLGGESGSSYVFENSAGWQQHAKLLPANGAGGDRFGSDVAFSNAGNRALVGSLLGNGISADSGAAYVFLNNGPNWAQLARLQANDGASGDTLGSGVALTGTGDKAFVGALGQDDLGTESGSAYLFPTACAGGPVTFFCFGDGSQTTACPCGNTGGANRGCANSQNSQGALLNEVGIVNPDNVVLTASGEPASSFSIFLQGDQEIIGGAVFGDGVRCAGGLLLRLYSKNASGGTVTAPDFSAGDPSITTRAAQLGQPIFPGTTRIYQVYYRDPNLAYCPAPPGNSFNITNAVRIDW